MAGAVTYGIRNKQTGQVEQIVEDTKAEAQRLARILNKDPRTRAGDDEAVVVPMHDGERVQFDVVKLADDGTIEE
jgi:hypothetical protein